MSDESAEVPFAERQAFRNGLEEGERRGRYAAEARIVAWLNSEAESLRELCMQPGVGHRQTLRDSSAAIFRVKEAIEQGAHRDKG